MDGAFPGGWRGTAVVLRAGSKLDSRFDGHGCTSQTVADIQDPGCRLALAGRDRTVLSWVADQVIGGNVSGTVRA